jgi:MtN3 and saliva related transmembrane protein
MDHVSVLGYLAGGLTTLSLLPQVIKIYKSRSAGDISVVMYLFFVAGISLWIIYGIAINSMPVIIANAISLCLGITVIILKIRFR